MQRLSLIALMALTAGPVLAGGPVEPLTEAPVAAPVAPAQASTDWSGFYAGLQYENLTGDSSTADPDDATDIDGSLYGFNAGYRRDFGQWVLGGELDYVTGDGDLTQNLSGAVFATDYDMLRLGVEAGIDAGRALVYGTVGYADITVNAEGSEISGDGTFYGVGVDSLLTERVMVGLEVLKHDFNDLGDAGDVDIDATTVSLSAAWRF